jgi:hypothetical protein
MRAYSGPNNVSILSQSSSFSSRHPPEVSHQFIGSVSHIVGTLEGTLEEGRGGHIETYVSSLRASDPQF